MLMKAPKVYIYIKKIINLWNPALFCELRCIGWSIMLALQASRRTAGIVCAAFCGYWYCGLLSGVVISVQNFWWTCCSVWRLILRGGAVNRLGSVALVQPEGIARCSVSRTPSITFCGSGSGRIDPLGKQFMCQTKSDEYSPMRLPLLPTTTWEWEWCTPWTRQATPAVLGLELKTWHCACHLFDVSFVAKVEAVQLGDCPDTEDRSQCRLL